MEIKANTREDRGLANIMILMYIMAQNRLKPRVSVNYVPAESFTTIDYLYLSI